MTTIAMAGKNIEVNEEGYMLNSNDWTPEIAQATAANIGISLQENHWKVINFMRKTFLAKGDAPSIRSLGKESGVSIKELYSIFPRGPAKIAAKIAGIPKPRGCI